MQTVCIKSGGKALGCPWPRTPSVTWIPKDPPREPEPAPLLSPCPRGQGCGAGPLRGAHSICAVAGWGGQGVLALFSGPVQLLQVPKL